MPRVERPEQFEPVHPAIDRLIALVLVLAAVFFIWILSAIPADARGHGTHEALGMGACSWPLEYQLPCPTCGVTTAATHLVQFSPWRAFVTQPFGAILTLFSLYLSWIALLSLLRGSSFMGRISRWPIPTLILSSLGLLLLSWLYKYLTWE